MKKNLLPIPRRTLALAVLALLTSLSGCAPAVPSNPTHLDMLGGQAGAGELQLQVAADIRLSTGYSRTLSTADHWRAVGRLPQGTVYRPVGTIFTVEGRNVHEAYLVIDRSGLVGFYLPAESRFSALENSIPLSFVTSP